MFCTRLRHNLGFMLIHMEHDRTEGYSNEELDQIIKIADAIHRIDLIKDKNV